MKSGKRAFFRARSALFSNHELRARAAVFEGRSGYFWACYIFSELIYSTLITSKCEICKTLTSKPDEILVTINPDLRNNHILFHQLRKFPIKIIFISGLCHIIAYLYQLLFLAPVLSEEIMKRLQYFGRPIETTVFQQHIKFSPKLQCLLLQPFYEDYLDLFSHLDKLQVLNLRYILMQEMIV